MKHMSEMPKRDSHESIRQRIARLYDYCSTRNMDLDCKSCEQSDSNKDNCLEHVKNELVEILSDTLDHFTNQEDQMKMLGFDLLHTGLFHTHVKHHADLMEELNSLVLDLSHFSASEIIMSLVTKLLSIFEHHADTHDRAYFSYLEQLATT